MKRSSVLALLAAMVVVLATAGSALGAKSTGFEGAWESVDPVDQSHQWLWITNYGGLHEVLYYDELCGSCAGNPGGSFGPPCTYVGAGGVTPEGKLSTDDGIFHCLWLEGPELLVKDYSLTYELMPDGTMTDNHASWTRSKDKQPGKVIQAWTEVKPTPPPPPNQPPVFDSQAFCAYTLSFAEAKQCACEATVDGTYCEVVPSSGALWLDFRVSLTDPDGDAMTYQVTGPELQGVVKASLPGSLTVTFWVYMEDFADWVNATDDFTFTTSDGTGEPRHRLGVNIVPILSW